MSLLDKGMYPQARVALELLIEEMERLRGKEDLRTRRCTIFPVNN
jgi:hypothetical protein